MTDAVNTDQLDFTALSAASDEEVVKTLTSLRDLGTWTAKKMVRFSNHIVGFTKLMAVRPLL